MTLIIKINNLIIEKLAKCYRLFHHADTDTNMYLERYADTLFIFNALSLGLALHIVFITN